MNADLPWRVSKLSFKRNISDLLVMEEKIYLSSLEDYWSQLN